ncbi:uncharacterized protein LOC143213354 [Lasioglossum baleicum]|uniref:uncharacterized protein LOC143213354 n=1 Tax=Lasioglossum baleicum TaxID=434251 RepID=UPI003FCEE565
MSTVCSSMESHRSHIKHSSYTERKQSQTMLSNVATTLPKTLSHQANASTGRVTNHTRDPTINRKRRGNNCDVQVVLTKISKLNDQAASCSKEKSVKEHSNAVDEDEVMVIYDSSSNNVSKRNSNSHSSDVASIQSNTRSNHNKHTDCNMQNVNHSTYLNSDISDTNNNINDEQSFVGSCKSTFQNVRRNNLSSNENKENLFINTSNCNKQSENGMTDGRARVGSRQYDKTSSNSNSTIAMEQCPIVSNQNDTSLSSPPYFVRIGDTVIKMEEELQITDTDEDAVWNSTNAFSMPIVFPVVFEQVPQQPKTEFSEEDVVTLRDTEDDTLRYPQLFDGCGMNTSMKQVVKEEVREEEAEVVSKDSGISSYVTDNKDGSFPYPQLVDRFDINTSMKLEIKEEVIELEAGAKHKDPDISAYVTDNKDGSFPYPQLVDRFDINTSMKLEIKEEVIEVEAGAKHKDPDISAYVTDNKDGSFPHPQLFDRFGMNTSMKQEIKEEVIELEAEAVPKDSGISSYVSDKKGGSFPHPQLFDRFRMNTSMKQKIKEEVIELEAGAKHKDPDISAYVTDNKDGSFPYPQLVDRFDINTSMKLEIKEEVIEVEAGAKHKDADISAYVTDNKDGSFPHPQLFDRFGMNTSMKQEIKEEVIELEAEAVPKDSGISSYVSDKKGGSFPHPQLFDRFRMNTSMKQKIKEKVIELEAEAVPKDSGISSYVSDKKGGSFPHPQLFDRFRMNTSMKQKIKEKVIELEAEAVPKDSGISSYVSDKKDGSFPHPQLVDRFDMNTSMKLEIKEEVIEVEAGAKHKDPDILAYVTDNKDGSFPHPQLFDRFGMNTSMKQEIKEEVIELEAEAVPKDSGISSYVSDKKGGSFPHPQLFDRFRMNTSMKQKIKEKVIEVEAGAKHKDPDILAYASDNWDGSFPYHQLFDRFGMNTSIKQEVKEEVVEMEAEAEPKDSGISAYASDNRDGSVPYPQSFDRFDMNTSMNQEIKEEVIEVEAEAEPKDSGISACASDNRDGSVPYPQSFDRFDMNTSMNQEVEEEVSEEEAEAEPEDSGISSYGNDDLVSSLSDSYDEDYWNWMRKLSRSRMLNHDEVRKEVKDHVTQNEVGHALDKTADKSPLNMNERLEVEKEREIEEEKERPKRHEDKYDDDRTMNEMHSLSTTSMKRMEVAAVNRAISLKESTSDSTISHKKSFKKKTPSSLGFRRQEADSRPTSSTTKPAVTPSKKSLERKVRQIEPHHLPTRRRSSGANSAREDPEKPPKERLSSEEKKELKEKAKIEDHKKDQKKRKAQNELPDCLTPSKKRASPLTKVEKKQLMDDGKKELIEKAKIEEYTRAKDQKKCRAQNELPDCLTPSKKRASPLSKGEKKKLMDDRKKELIEKTKIEEYTRAEDQKKCRAQNELPDCLTPSKKRASPLIKIEKKQLMDDRRKELIEKTKIEEYTRAKDQKKCRAQNEKKGLEEKAKIEEYMRVKKQKKCRAQNVLAAQNTSPLTQEEKKQLIADRKKKLKEIALKGRRSSEENNQENTISDVLASPRTPDSVKDREAAKEMPTQLQSSAPHSRIARIPRKSNAAEAKMKVSTGDAPEKAVRSQKMKDIESTSKRAEVAKYKSTGPVIAASSILKSPEKKTTKKIDESNVLNRLAGNDAAMPRKSMYDEMTNNFLLHIFRWPPIWLEQQQSQLRLDRTAPIVPDDVLHEMLTHYKSYDEYYRAILPRVLLETWHEITRNFAPVDNCRQPTLMCSIIENSIQTKTLSSNLQLTTLGLEVLVTRKDREKKAYPVEGDLVFLEYSNIEQEGQTFIKVFGYVDDDRQTILSDNTHYNKELMNYVERPYALITYIIRTKPLKPGIVVNKVARLTRAGKLRPNLQMVQALEYLPKSPLMNLILSPKIEEYCLPTVPIQSEQLFTREKLNKKQLEAVFKVTETIVQNQAKLCFIQGPPGTGKSTVIVNIVSQVLYNKRRYTSSKGALKILVCAPTNAAIDEITLRLLQIRSSMKQNQFNIVRIGQTGVTDPVVKNISVTELTKQEMKRTRTSSMNIPLDSVKEKSRVKIHSLMCTSTHNMCDCEDHLQTTTARLNKKESVRIQQDAETAVLSQADIITCTLSSIYSKQAETFFMANKKGISVCIMDEATQSTEAETLIPLMLGVNTLVLVGDPNQLPATIPSPRGKIEGRDQSIFSRIQNAFEMNPANPIIMLDTQYRMSHDICRWPSKFLYAGNLETGTPPNEEFPFHPYRLFNIYTSQNNDNSNTAEAQFVANMMYTMVTQANLDGWECISYGILTPYNNQKPVILAKINEILSLLPDIIRKKIKFEVSTIDGFRGKERDVVMLSCVRSQHIGCLSDRQRLSVALTRAKHSLIICGNIGLFNKDPIWNSLLSDAKSREVYFKVDAQAESWEIKPLVVKRSRCSR